MSSLFFSVLLACVRSSTCGPGTHLGDDDLCVADDDEGGGGSSSDPCRPPDTFWGAVPEALVTTTPYGEPYDAGLEAVWPFMLQCGNCTPGQTFSIVEATVAIPPLPNLGQQDSIYYVEDGRISAGGAPWNLPYEAAAGDRLSFTTRSFSNRSGEALFEQLTEPVIVSSGNPVYVRELGSTPLDYWNRGAEIVHVWGRVVETLEDDCGMGFTCHVLEHGGTRDVIRVKDDNAYDLEPGVTGVCLEAVAGTGTYDPDPYDGDAGPSRLNVTSDELFRVWVP